MYSFHRLTQANQQYVFSFNGTARAKSQAMSFAIASVLVNSVSFIKDVKKTHFDQEHVTLLTQQFSQLNEILRIDIDQILNYARKLYQYRLSFMTAQEAPNPVCSPETAVVDFFGITRFLSKEDLKMIGECGVQISIDAMELRSLLSSLGFFDENACVVKAGSAVPQEA